MLSVQPKLVRPLDVGPADDGVRHHASSHPGKTSACSPPFRTADLILTLGLMSLEWEQVVVDAARPAELGRWWAEALGWVVVFESDEEFEIRPAPDRLPGLLFVPVADPKTTKNRMHPDFRPGPATTRKPSRPRRGPRPAISRHNTPGTKRQGCKASSASVTAHLMNVAVKPDLVAMPFT